MEAQEGQDPGGGRHRVSDASPRPEVTPALARRHRGRRLIASMLTGLGLIAVLAGGAWVIFALQPFGRRGWAFVAVSAPLVPLAWGLRRRGLPVESTSVGRASRRRIPRPIRKVLLGELAVWSGLIAWSALSPGGPMPPPKADPAAIRLLSWNILLGVEEGPPWVRHGWPVRKPALRAALRAAAPDILCVQEALDGQVKFLEAELPRHRRVGVGRDDGRSAGEHCAIYFDAGRFEPLDGGTFWLEEPADEPPDDLTLGPKRICTWVRIRDRLGGRTLRIYNTHLYLTERANRRAVRILLARVGSGDASDEVLIVGDFNAPPGAPSRRLFHEAGLVSAAELSGEAVGLPTYQFYGIRSRSLDDIYLGRGWRHVRYRVVDAKPGNTFPSDHLGILADLESGP